MNAIAAGRAAAVVLSPFLTLAPLSV